ncbi:hypothetical protein [Streptomyces sp. NPDC058279]|uniref:hypothetical protein n=1 Tax=Streptomyces sp. NPDC058279 TaxID=3346418 RepID=UPI0036E98F4C
MTSISNVEQALENQMLSLAKLEIDAAPLPAWRDTFTASDELSAQLKSLKVQAVDILLAGPVQIAPRIAPVVDGLNEEWLALHSGMCEFRWKEAEQNAFSAAREQASRAISDLGSLASQILNADE